MFKNIPIRYTQRFIFWAIHICSAVIFGAAAWFTPEYLGHAFVGSIALIAIFHNTKINTRRATVEILLKLVTDKDTIEDFKTVQQASFDTDRVANIACGTTSKLSPQPTEKEELESQALMRLLNFYEFICLGVRRRALDYRMMHELQHSNVTRIWKQYKAIVIKIRDISKADKVFQEISALAAEFEDHELKKHR